MQMEKLSLILYLKLRVYNIYVRVQTWKKPQSLHAVNNLSSSASSIAFSCSEALKSKTGMVGKVVSFDQIVGSCGRIYISGIPISGFMGMSITPISERELSKTLTYCDEAIDKLN